MKTKMNYSLIAFALMANATQFTHAGTSSHGDGDGVVLADFKDMSISGKNNDTIMPQVNLLKNNLIIKTKYNSTKYAKKLVRVSDFKVNDYIDKVYQVVTKKNIAPIIKAYVDLKSNGISSSFKESPLFNLIKDERISAVFEPNNVKRYFTAS